MDKIKVLIADDHRLLRETLIYFLNADPRFHVVAACADSEEAVRMVMEKMPDVVLMDINILPYSGIEATEKICTNPNARVIGMSMHKDPVYVKKMIKSGAKGYVTKNVSMEEMFAAITDVVKGNRYICHEVMDIISEDILHDKNDTPALISLTKREIEIIKLVKEGFSSKEMATGLDIALKTVEVHRHNILKKLKCKKSSALVNLVHSYPGYIS